MMIEKEVAQIIAATCFGIIAGIAYLRDDKQSAFYAVVSLTFYIQATH